ADYEIASLTGFKGSKLFLARDDDPTGFADALTMGAAAAKIDAIPGLGAGAPTSNSLPSTTTAELGKLKPGTIYIPGGTSAVTQAQEDAAVAASQGAAGAGVTSLPELVSASITETVPDA